MIRDAVARSEIVGDWAVVRKLSSSVHLSAALPGNGWINETRPEDAYNLPLVLAYSVLEHVLDERINQKDFSCRVRKLGPMMTAAHSRIQWRDYDTVEAGREARNRFAHEGVLVAKVDCLRFIDAIEHELRYWGII